MTIVEGGEALHHCLEALSTQRGPPVTEVIVPYDASVADSAALAEKFPHVTFLDLGVIQTERSIDTEAGRHELYDRRRAAGLASGRGPLLAILEDRGAPSPTWAREIVRLHEQPYAVIGGAIECRPTSLLNWAVYVCDFGRYSLPFEAGATRWVSDINVSYKRRALETTRESWTKRFHEPLVHGELLARGETLFLSPEIVVEHRRRAIPLGALLAERFHWGQLFGSMRAGRLSASKRLAYILLGPLLPPFLLARHGLVQSKKRNFVRFLLACPAIILLLTAWSIGEMLGTLTREA